ncbi:DNA topoisomerase 4 subunit A [Roseovarius sp. EC-HK134]|uniref:DNA topoisomerase 4 subunit A n=1 Tax=Roseovarius mucosus TaxID=215743 RepID=A0A1V0RSP5_9RHOB|nr:MULTISPECIES: DNA topoisomerase IV subunit A [Roseovarius]ARE84716.1 DNA topoisomerase 4 subunit A [Roseovarius mucosus]EDM32729.1 DNA topoisomerase IV subunit A [Roseovarius sp. TM1035]VVT20957.1 DNA topoisomerase 4 subunit A [Roseovarius sp. EC-SD190]VVT21062.1 DNA topoisomerase 4 subunit A [Roseovarius sp. EC-HK134]|tara:strand:- start:250 stop:2556 length:2307 start_codon:yes stop_codon:yes gene_type:complete
MSDLLDDPNMQPEAVSEPLRRAIGERYLTYALSTIMHRALPDARDGLKPVHRRILYAMRELRLSSSGGFRKSAKISGDVMGNYHPHGDAAIYDAMARLAQDFAVRYPLVDGQGNFGNIDGDNPAASRYTEARMTAFAEALLDGLAEDAVDFRDNYDGTLREPVVLPASFPNLLANGSSGIAVGMATNIPPHNIAELIDACLHLIKSPDARDDTLLQYIPGPDFPTGGVIVEPPESIAQAYLTGRGAFRLRCKWELEDLGRGQWQIVVTEIPYQVQKSKLIERIAELIQTRKVPILADVRDESADDVRLVLEPRSKNVDPEVLMGMMYRNSELEVRFSLNMNVLIDGVTPKVCSLKEVLRAFLDFRQQVLLRRSVHRMEKIDHRLEVLEGLIIAFLNLDRVIDIIRYDEDPKAALMREDWGRTVPRAMSEADYVPPPPTAEAGLTEVQAEAILNMRLRSLRRLEEMELRAERDTLMAERAGLEDLLDDVSLQWAAVADQLKEVKKTFGKTHPIGARRTQFAEAGSVEDVPLEAMIDREPITVVCSQMGWIRAMTGHLDLSRELKFKDGDGPRFMFHAETTDRILVFGSNGRFYTLSASNLPGGRGMGEPLRLMVDLPNEAGIVDLLIHKPGRKLLVASDAGDGFIVPEEEVIAQTRSGKQVLNLKEPARALVCRPVTGDHVACVGDNRKVLVFALDELPELGRGKGVRLQKYKDGGLSDATTFDLAAGLTWRDPAGRTRTESNLEEWLGKRAGSGRMAPRGFPRDNRFT